MKIQQLTGKGKRETNQDLLCINRLDCGASLFLIADGMGGYVKGDEAARIVSESISTFLNYAEVINEHSIQQAIQKANLAVKQFNTRNNIKSGATIGGIIVEKDVSHVFWVGDVMVYQINKDKVIFQTKSHTLVNSLLESDSIKEAKSLEKYKHIVTRSISGKPSESNIGYYSAAFSEEDLFIICSDGFHNYISIEQLILNIDKGIDLRIFEEQLQREANDNFSAIIVDTNNDK